MKIKNVACALLVKDNKLLLQDRKSISKYGEEWSFFGGGIEDGENSKEALIREIKEELGFDISSWEISYLGEIVHYTDFGIEYHRFLYGIKIPENINIFDDKEGSGAYFFSLDEARKLKFNTNIDAEISQLENNFL
ncbi:NUDIX hydrolase [Candidatus Gracilibacteria bacterium]|nr:NUDIX hydrolase [Candidatus Gracilibacteria bacterium]RKW21978.1 MAG: NUDIX hydrolase [Candidatus Gracilibacteria bacterium]